MGKPGDDQRDGGAKQSKPSCLRRFSSAVIELLETLFYRWGLLIGKYPWAFILGVVVMVGICGSGMVFFTEENRQEELWVPMGSQALQDKAWVDEKFPTKTRFETMLLVGDDVLQPNVLQAMMTLHRNIITIQKNGTYNWESICARYGTRCWSQSLLELWSFNETKIAALTRQDILKAVNNVTRSPVYGYTYDVTKFLGTISRDSDGSILSARATSMNYYLIQNSTVIKGREVDETAQDWELAFINIGKAGHPDIQEIHVYARRSFGDEGGGAITGDIRLLSAGYFVIIIFVATVLGNFNAVHHRIYVSLCGVLCVGFAIVISFGLSSYCQLFYGPVHSILPFLLLGIGVDDMFVVVQAWENLGPTAKDLPIQEKIALMMKHAGMSITVTSLTDIVAFGIGATTILPALRSFCIYACIGILATFCCQATFFVACIALDERRALASRDACCCCHVHRNYQPNQCSQKPLIQTFCQNYYGPFLVKLPVKIVTLLVTAVLVGVNIWGVINLKQEFDPAWFIPSSSYASKWIAANELHFPSDGRATGVFIGPTDHYNNYELLEKLHLNVANDEYTYKGTTESWFYSFRQWLNDTQFPGVSFMVRPSDRFPSTEENFYKLLQMYIYADQTSGGIRFVKDIKFYNTSSNVQNISASRITLKHRNMKDSREEIAGMESLRKLTENAGLGYTVCFPYSRFYLTYEGNRVIQQELYKNLGIAFACVFLMTLLLIANLWTCILVCTCVIMTLVDVGGMMFMWGLTIDTVTSVILILAIGLAVDYAAHIGHTFMTERGTRDERTIQTSAHMAPAVFYGGFSTFLAFVLLAGSGSYVFITFFKVFFGVVLFGLFHGLVYLPVILSWVGPAPYLISEEGHDHRTTHVNVIAVNGVLNVSAVTSSNHCNFQNMHWNWYHNRWSRLHTRLDAPYTYHPRPHRPVAPPRCYRFQNDQRQGMGRYKQVHFDYLVYHYV